MDSTIDIIIKVAGIATPVLAFVAGIVWFVLKNSVVTKGEWLAQIKAEQEEQQIIRNGYEERIKNILADHARIVNEYKRKILDQGKMILRLQRELKKCRTGEHNVIEVDEDSLLG